MFVQVTCNRACLRTSRAEFHYFLFTRIYPKTDTNATFPGAAAINTAAKALWGNYYTEHSAGNTAKASQFYVKIIDSTVKLMVLCEGLCSNDIVVLATSGFTPNKLTKTEEPQTAIPTNLMQMVQGNGKFKIEYTCDEYMHYCKGRTRLKGSDDSAWVEKESSETETMQFEGYKRANEMEVQTCAVGTKGQSDWSVSIFVLVQ